MKTFELMLLQSIFISSTYTLYSDHDHVYRLRDRDSSNGNGEDFNDPNDNINISPGDVFTTQHYLFMEIYKQFQEKLHMVYF